MPPKAKATKKQKPRKSQVAAAPPMVQQPAPPVQQQPQAAPAPAPAVEAEAAMGRVTVKYNIYKNEYPTRDGALTMEALDEELAISFGFPGAFVARLRPVDGERVFTCSPPGTAGLFENLPDGDYVLEVDEDPAEAVASVAVVAVARPALRLEVAIAAPAAPALGARARLDFL